MKREIETVACAGAGLVGQGWPAIFALGGSMSSSKTSSPGGLRRP
jgi:3-hydroxyacyl-CoA dehydrogenase